MPSIPAEGDEYYPLVSSWMLRLLLGREGAFRRFFSEGNGFRDGDVAEFLRLSDLDEYEISSEDLKKLLADRLRQAECRPDRKTPLFHNLAMLSRHLRLTGAQRRILAFAVLRERYGPLNDTLGMLQISSESALWGALALALKLSPGAVRKALMASGVLRETGLIKLEGEFRGGLSLDPMEGLGDVLLSDNESEEDLLRHFLKPSRQPALRASNFPHVKSDIDILRRLLRVALEEGATGVNILLYGPPGTGKTELARLLAREAGGTLFEVKTEDADGDPIGANNRLAGYRLSQQLLANGWNGVILFDEIEDVFPVRAFSLFGLEMRSSANKGWINKVLEENRTPAIWICNRIGHMDPAFLRRFDYALELRTPPRSVRLDILQRHFRDTPVSRELIRTLALNEDMSPALAGSAARVVRLMHIDNREQADAVARRVIAQKMRALGQELATGEPEHATRYDPMLINADADIPALIDGLRRSGRGNVCFYGPPGTGKTALVAHIAERLDRPLLLRRASDILSMWVGESEKNIARMFREARDEQAVLLLDEADSFLRDRRGARNSWEVTQVNELLVQMEHFDGLFICSTNLMDDIDQAALRRFALKVRFDWLSPEQAWRMLRREAADTPARADRAALAAISNLAPGDFAAVKKRLSMLGIRPTARELLAGLVEECRLKEGGLRQPMGFAVH